MKTVIPINGLEVEFTDKTPARPGAYWLCDDSKDLLCCKVVCVRIDNGVAKFKLRGQWVDAEFYGRLWSAPLVPVTEVEAAWFEGRDSIDPLCDMVQEAFKESRARRVVEGKP